MIVKFIESMIDDVALEVIAHNLKVNIRTAPYDCDQYGLECDVVPHFDNNMFMLAEIKSGSAHIGHAAKNLKRLKELIVENRMTTPMPWSSSRPENEHAEDRIASCGPDRMLEALKTCVARCNC